MPIKNYTTSMSVEQSVMAIQKCLLAHGAEGFSTRYDGKTLISLAFLIKTKHGKLAFSLPANITGVQQCLINDGLGGKTITLEHSAQVAWRTLRDWVEAQMAIVEAEMVELEEIFLPYMITGDKTLYQYMLDKGFPQLEEGHG
jgi:hypothetical protein